MLNLEQQEANIAQLDTDTSLTRTQSSQSLSIFGIHNVDARHLDSVIKGELVDVTVTSPPYFDLKDYGHEDQIGYGQKYDQYLEDLKTVFSKVFFVTKDTGSLWVVIDSFKRDGAIVPLPFDFAAKLQEIGWKLQDIIIWHKDKTVPWVNGGVTRGIFEYVLLFTKQPKYKYYVDKVRNYQDLKKWWVKYPERYHPKGKSLDEVWHFPIPTQGSWGSGYIKHFCPLPEGLVNRIITLTTDENDVVLDPFSGSGTVPAQALFRNRNYIGFELNKAYIEMFHTYVEANHQSKSSEFTQSIEKLRESDAFEKLMLDLRALKLARVIKKELLVHDIRASKIFVERLLEEPDNTKNFARVFFRVLIDKEVNFLELTQTIKSTAAISKFRLEEKIDFVINEQSFYDQLPEGNLYLYTDKNTHSYKSKINKNIRESGLVLSQIKVELVEKNYE